MSDRPVSPLELPRPGVLRYAELAAAFIGGLALFAATSAFGMLEVHSSTDTWIGLAAGRQILTSETFPTHDTFSYTFDGEVWFNQNWLTHVWQFWLYDRFGENAVVYGTWAMCVCIFGFSFLACWWRSGTALGAVIAASIVAFGCRDFVSARPATTGFFCLSALWAILCALEGQGDKRRWWPIAALLPLMLVWGNAHGSFVFAYGILLAYVGHWLVIRYVRDRLLGIASLVIPLVAFVVAAVVLKETKAIGLVVAYGAYWGLTYWLEPRNVITARQVLGICAVSVLAVVLTMIVSPYGIGNFLHPGKVAGSEVFRQVSEWRPPLEKGGFPPVFRFWYIFGGSIAALMAAWAANLVLSLRPRPSATAEPADGARPLLHTSLFDVAVVAVGIVMTFWARRFAPMFFLFGAPVILVWVLNLTRAAPAMPRLIFRYVMIAGTFAGAAVVGSMAERRATRELVTTFEERGREFSLLERVCRFDGSAIDAFELIARNELPVNLFCEWTEGGVVMFRVPTAKVFIDGRSQQVYDEEHYRRYFALLVADRADPQDCLAEIERWQTDCIVLRHTQQTLRLRQLLASTPQWLQLVTYPNYTLYLHQGSAAFTALSQRIRSGTAWFPENAMGLVGRGLVCAVMTPPDLREAIRSWRNAVRLYTAAGAACYERITRAHLMLGEVDEAVKYVNRQIEVVGGATLAEEQKAALLAALRRCSGMIESQRRGSNRSDGSNP